MKFTPKTRFTFQLMLSVGFKLLATVLYFRLKIDSHKSINKRAWSELHCRYNSTNVKTAYYLDFKTKKRRFFQCTPVEDGSKWKNHGPLGDALGFALVQEENYWLQALPRQLPLRQSLNCPAQPKPFAYQEWRRNQCQRLCEFAKAFGTWFKSEVTPKGKEAMVWRHHSMFNSKSKLPSKQCNINANSMSMCSFLQNVSKKLTPSTKL